MTEKERAKKISEALVSVYKMLTDSYGYSLVYLAVQGSTNYGLDIYTDEYQSDIDMKAFMLPSFDNLYDNDSLTGKVISTPYGQVTVFDARKAIELCKKANPSLAEIFYTNAYIGEANFRKYCRGVIEERRGLLIYGMYGMVMQKSDALTHRYEGLAEKIDRFGGYDPKQLHHALRLNEMLRLMIHKNASFADVLILPKETREELIDVKVHGVGSLQNALNIMSQVVEQTKEIVKDVSRVPTSNVMVDKLTDHIKTLIKINIGSEFMKMQTKGNAA